MTRGVVHCFTGTLPDYGVGLVVGQPPEQRRDQQSEIGEPVAVALPSPTWVEWDLRQPSRPLLHVACEVDEGAVATLALAGSAAAVPSWAPAGSATIHPGVQTVTEGSGQCTANFVFSSYTSMTSSQRPAKSLRKWKARFMSLSTVPSPLPAGTMRRSRSSENRLISE